MISIYFSLAVILTPVLRVCFFSCVSLLLISLFDFGKYDDAAAAVTVVWFLVEQISMATNFESFNIQNTLKPKINMKSLKNFKIHKTKVTTSIEMTVICRYLCEVLFKNKNKIWNSNALIAFLPCHKIQTFVHTLKTWNIEWWRWWPKFKSEPFHMGKGS